MRKIRIWPVVVLPVWALLAAGCSKSGGGEDGKIPLSFVSAGVETDLAPVKAPTVLPLPENTPVRVSARRSGEYSDGAYTSDAAGTLAGNPLYLLPSAVDYTVAAWSPDTPANTDKTTVDVRQGTDFLATADKTVTVPVQTPSLSVTLPVFSHKCARVELEVVRDESYTSLTSLEIWDKGVVMSNMPASPGSYSPGGDIAPDDDPATDLTLAVASFSAVTDGRLGVNTVYVTLPKGEKVIPIAFPLVLNGNYLTFKGEVPEMSLFKGLGYKFVMSLRANQAALELRITDWTGHEINYEAGAGTGIVIGTWEIIEYDTEAGAGTGIKIGDWTPVEWQSQIGAGTQFSVNDWVEHEISYMIGRD